MAVEATKSSDYRKIFPQLRYGGYGALIRYGVYGALIRYGLYMALILLVACAPRTNLDKFSMEPTGSFSLSGTDLVEEKWWRSFGDEQLNLLVDTALEHNFTIASTMERLMAARATVDRESASFFPALDGFLTFQAEGPEGTGREVAGLRAGLSASYEIDLWGRIGATVDAERYRADATYSDYQVAALTISAEIVSTWFQLSEANSQLLLATKQVETNEQILELIRNRFITGLVRNVDLLRQKELVESTRELQIIARSRASVLRNKLAVLTGSSPLEQTSFAVDGLPELPPVPESGIPSELLARRPDVQGAFNRLQAADRDLAAAISNRYPRLTLSAAVSFSPDQMDNVLENWAYSLAGNLLAPLFYGGELKAEVSRNEAVRAQLFNDYALTVLDAIREVEDALVREKFQTERLESINRQLDLADNSYQQLQVQYFNGVSNYLDVLTALNDLQRLRRNVLTEKLVLLEYRVALYRALAGDFEMNAYR